MRLRKNNKYSSPMEKLPETDNPLIKKFREKARKAKMNADPPLCFPTPGQQINEKKKLRSMMKNL